MKNIRVYYNDAGLPEYSLQASLSNETPAAPLYSIMLNGNVINSGALTVTPPSLLTDVQSWATPNGWTIAIIVGSGGVAYLTATDGNQTLRSNTITIPGEWLGTKPWPDGASIISSPPSFLTEIENIISGIFNDNGNIHAKIGWAEDGFVNPKTRNVAGTFNDIEYSNANQFGASISNETAADIAQTIYNAKGFIFSDQQSVLSAFGRIKNTGDVALIAGMFQDLYNADMYAYLSTFMSPFFGHDYMDDLNAIVKGLQ